MLTMRSCCVWALEMAVRKERMLEVEVRTLFWLPVT